MSKLQEIFQNMQKIALTGLKKDQELIAFKKAADELLMENGEPRFSDIDSKEFINIIDFLNQMFTNRAYTKRVRFMAARYAYFKFSTCLPKSGLPLTNRYIQGIVDWSLKIINFDESSDEYVQEQKYDQVEILSGLYQRRFKYDLAVECIENFIPSMLESPCYKYPIIHKSLYSIIVIREKMISPEHTLQSTEMMDLIKALENAIAFSSNIPDAKKTMTLYISPAQALQQFEAIRNNEKYHVLEGPMGDQESIDDTLNNPTTTYGTLDWDRQEKWSAEDNCIRAKGKLGKLLAVTPKAPGENPDYQLAARWLRAAQGSRYTFYANIDDALKIPEIKTAMTELNNNSPMATITFSYDNLIKVKNGTASNSNTHEAQNSKNEPSPI